MTNLRALDLSTFRVDKKYEDQPNKRLSNALRFLSKLTYLCVSDFHGDEESDLLSLSILRSLSVDNSVHWERCQPLLHQLENLHLQWKTTEIIPFLNTLTNLRRLRIDTCMQLIKNENKEPETLLSFLPPNLEHFIMCGSLPYRFFTVLPNRLQSLPNQLKSLNLRKIDITEEDVDPLPSTLQHLRVQSFYAPFGITNKLFQLLPPFLLSLDISCLKAETLTDEAFSYLPASLISLYMDLAELPFITNKAFEHIANRCPRLRHLSFLGRHFALDLTTEVYDFLGQIPAYFIRPSRESFSKYKENLRKREESELAQRQLVPSPGTRHRANPYQRALKGW